MKTVVFVDMREAPDVLLVETEKEILVNLAAAGATPESHGWQQSPQE